MNELLLIISFTFMIINLIYLIINSFKKKKYSSKTLLILFALFLIPLTILAYNVEPGRTTDLYDHFKLIDQLRAYNYSLKLNNDALLTIKIIYIIVAFLNNNHILPALSSIVAYSVFFFILYKEAKKKEITCFLIFYSIMSFLALCSNYYIITGIKTPFAFAFFALAVYFDKNKYIKKSILFMLLSLFSHGMMISIITLYYISKTNIMKNNTKYLIIFFPLLINIIYFILSKIPISIFQYIANKILLYTQEDALSSSNWIYLLDILYCIFLLMRYIFSKRKAKNKEDKDYLNLMQIIMLFIISGSTFTKIMIERGIMLISYFNYKNLLIENNKKTNLIFIAIDFMYFSLKILYFIVRLTSHSTIIS